MLQPNKHIQQLFNEKGKNMFETVEDLEPEYSKKYLF
jgi:hypothetical protein